ncbi:MAG: hypothetical protein AAF914_10120, partial [Pseudomonadota bacterium]
MELARDILFDPLLSWPVIWAVAAVAVLFIGLALWRRLAGWPLRAAGFAVLIVALANPALQDEDRAPLTDIVLLVVDESASQRVSDRPEQTLAAVSAVEAEVAALGMELRVARVGDGEENSGTRLMAALSELLAEAPRARIAGAIFVTDGQLHDADLVPELPAPLHAILTGRETDWDRRLVVEN